MATKIVRVSRPVIPPDGPWRAIDAKGEHDDEFYPDDWMRSAMGARMVGYFRAVWSIDGWQFRSFMANLPNNLRF